MSASGRRSRTMATHLVEPHGLAGDVVDAGARRGRAERRDDRAAASSAWTSRYGWSRTGVEPERSPRQPGVDDRSSRFGQPPAGPVGLAEAQRDDVEPVAVGVDLPEQVTERLRRRERRARAERGVLVDVLVLVAVHRMDDSSTMRPPKPASRAASRRCSVPKALAVTVAAGIPSESSGSDMPGGVDDPADVGRGDRARPAGPRSKSSPRTDVDARTGSPAPAEARS